MGQSLGLNLDYVILDFLIMIIVCQRVGIQCLFEGELGGFGEREREGRKERGWREREGRKKEWGEKGEREGERGRGKGRKKGREERGLGGGERGVEILVGSFVGLVFFEFCCNGMYQVGKVGEGIY